LTKLTFQVKTLTFASRFCFTSPPRQYILQPFLQEAFPGKPMLGNIRGNPLYHSSSRYSFDESQGGFERKCRYSSLATNRLGRQIMSHSEAAFAKSIHLCRLQRSSSCIIQRESIHKYLCPNFLVIKIASWKVFDSWSHSIPIFLCSIVFIVVVMI